MQRGTIFISNKTHPGLQKGFTVPWGARVPNRWLCCRERSRRGREGWRVGEGWREGWREAGGLLRSSRDGAPAPGGRTALLTASPTPFPATVLPITIPSCSCFGNASAVPAWDGSMQPIYPCGPHVPPISLCSCCCSLPQSCQRGHKAVSQGEPGCLARVLQAVHRLRSA